MATPRNDARRVALLLNQPLNIGDRIFFCQPRGNSRPEVKKELAVLMRPQVLSALLTTVLGAGAMFTLYTYISPVLQSITHATPVFVTAMLC